MKLIGKMTAVVVSVATTCAADDVVKSLAGEWRVTGENLSGVVQLPGTLADAKLGTHKTAADWEADTDRRSKGALTREWQYIGTAVYEREIELTEEEARYPLELVMERVMLHSELVIDGEAIGSCDSLAVEHVYPIPQRLTKAGRHVIRLTLDNSNRYNFSEWAHSYGPVMQSVWHGVVGEFALRRQSALRKARVFASWPANGKLVVEVPESFEVKEGNIDIAMVGRGVQSPRPTIASVKPSPYRKGFKLVELKLDREPEPWSEHHPTLYTLTLRDEAADFTHSIRFGFRSVSAHDHAIWINGHKWFMRGNLDCCHFPLTGAPDTSIEWWRETFRRLRDEDGINTIRFHSWTPPKAAFDAADELGMIFAVEAGIWVDRWHKNADKMGFGKPIDGFVQRELRTILERRGNSPSFLSLGIGNELGGNDFKVMGKWLNDCKTFDPRLLYVASANQYMSDGVLQRVSEADDYLVVSGRWRGRRHPFTDWDYEEGYAGLKFPAVAHEVGQWPIYVDWPHELARYTGVLRPYNLEHFRDVAEKSGTRRLWPRFCAASARLNRLLYKDNVEGLMRTPSCTGLQLLSAQDFTGQFEAMIGWRDSFYDLKPAVKALPPFRDVFNETPHLARFGKYCWSVGETYKATLLLRNITEKPILEGTEFGYSILGQRASCPLTMKECSLRLPKTIAPGEVGVVGEVTLPLTAEMAGKKFMLKFGRNSWPFWVFESTGKMPVVPVALPTGKMPVVPVTVTASFDEAVAALAKGGKVLYTGKSAKSAKSYFRPVYWSAGHFKQADAELSSLGYAVRSDHPVFRGFPTENWADWHWYNLVEGGIKHRLAEVLGSIDPIVMPVPDLHYSTFMGTLFELSVGDGRLMVCGLNLSHEELPEVRAMKKSLLAYMASDAFNPTISVDVEKFKEAFAPRIPEAKRRPAEFADAPVYIAAAVELEVERRDVPWKPSLDMAQMKRGSYKVSGKGKWGTWRDATGFFWHGRGLSVTLTGVNPVNGTLFVRFRDPNGLGRTGRGTCEGRSFSIPKHQDAKDGIFWAKMPVMNEDFLDGKIELSCEAVTGPNLMIDRVVLMEDK
ncbi:MAG: hypothetical protein J6T51_07545 [Kiritimatiellae bacterium]|nr:hypothetical protein [Kiritimatiellia bacterium]